MVQFVIKTQTLENYGAHAEDGKFSSGNAYWKFKGGNDYIVSDCDRLQDAVAFVMAAFSENNLGFKEFPSEFLTMQEWHAQLADLDDDYVDFIMKHAKHVSPLDGDEYADRTIVRNMVPA